MAIQTSYVYIMSSTSGTLYIGGTSNLAKRVYEHKSGKIKGFSEKYKTKKLIYYEEFADIRIAISREKQLKGWKRSKKMALIKTMNAEFIVITKSRIRNMMLFSQAIQRIKILPQRKLKFLTNNLTLC